MRLYMILFGWGKRTVKNFGNTAPLHCSNCNNDTFYSLHRVKTWFTLFFIPVIPYSIKHLLLCNICGKGMQLKGNKIQEAKELTRMTKQFNNKELTKEEYQNHLDQSGLFTQGKV